MSLLKARSLGGLFTTKPALTELGRHKGSSYVLLAKVRPDQNGNIHFNYFRVIKYYQLVVKSVENRPTYSSTLF